MLLISLMRGTTSEQAKKAHRQLRALDVKVVSSIILKQQYLRQFQLTSSHASGR